MKKINLGESYIYENRSRKFNRKPSLTQLVVRLLVVEHKPMHAHFCFFPVWNIGFSPKSYFSVKLNHSCKNAFFLFGTPYFLGNLIFSVKLNHSCKIYI